jgi:hypothetical protein
MSSALARKKRIGESAPLPTTNPNAPKASGLTLPQVINVIDNRLIALETYVKNNQNQNPGLNQTQNQNSSVEEVVPFSNDFMNEMQSRYEILAQEIGELKDIVLKLQTYTMDVNKTLLEERIHILSDLGNNNESEKEEKLEFSDV